jgi:hypothetical protein
MAVCSCDIDGDGEEELYIHNHNDVYPVSEDVTIVPDKLFKMINGQHVDLFALSDTQMKMAPRHGGYSVACIDRMSGSGQYDVIVTTYTKGDFYVHLNNYKDCVVINITFNLRLYTKCLMKFNSRKTTIVFQYSTSAVCAILELDKPPLFYKFSTTIYFTYMKNYK